MLELVLELENKRHSCKGAVWQARPDGARALEANQGGAREARASNLPISTTE